VEQRSARWGLAHNVGPARLVDYHAILVDRTYIAKHITLTASSITWFLLIALTLGSCVASLWPYKVVINSNEGSAWLIAFSDIPQEAARRQKTGEPHVIVQVKMKSGLQYTGLLQYYSKDAALADRELILKPPIAIHGESRDCASPSDWHRLILPGSEVAEVFVQYRSAGAEDSGIALSLSHRAMTIAVAVFSKLYRKSDDSAWLANLLGAEILALFLYVSI
jgi:hypothetical protein